MNSEIKITATEIIRLLQQKYKGKGVFSGNDSKSTAMLIMEYITRINDLQIDKETIQEYTQYILQKSIDFKDFPPSTEQYFNGLSHWIKSKGLSESAKLNSFDIEFDRFYEEISIRYELRWARNQIASLDAHKLTWKSELIACNATAADINNAKLAMLNSGIYINSPPTLQSFIEILKIARLGMDIPIPETAFGIASSHRNSANMNVFVRAARAKIGYANLIDRSDFTVKQRFEMEYRRLLHAYMSGSISIEDIEPKNCEIETPIPAEKNYALNSIQRMINKLNKTTN